jgi:hypothetical protein
MSASPAVPPAAADARRRTVADDPAWRRRLAARAVLAVAIGAAVGLAGGRAARRR